MSSCNLLCGEERCVTTRATRTPGDTYHSHRNPEIPVGKSNVGKYCSQWQLLSSTLTLHYLALALTTCYYPRSTEGHIACLATPRPEGGRVRPIMAYTGRLRRKGRPFSPVGYPLWWPTRGGSARKGYFFRLQVYERVGISLVEVYKRVGKSVIWVCKRAQKD